MKDDHGWLSIARELLWIADDLQVLLVLCSKERINSSHIRTFVSIA